MTSRLRAIASWLLLRREWFIAPLAYVVLVGALYHTIWFPPEGRQPQYFGWDVPEAYWPDMAYMARSIANGEAPLWNPYNRGGYAFYADLLPGVFYPGTWVFAAPGAIADAMPPWTVQLKVLLHHVLGGVLLYAFLRRRKLPWSASFIGGAGFVVSLPMIIHKASALIWGLVWAPLLLLLVDLLIERARGRGWWHVSAALAAACWCAGAAGMPQGSFMAFIVAVVYGSVRLAQHLRDSYRAGELRADAIAQTRALAVAGALALSLLAIVVLPTLHEAAESATRGATRGLGYVLTFRVPEKSLRGALAPGTGPLDMYGGLVILVLALCALLAAPRADRGAPLVFAALTVFAVLLCHGLDGKILPWLSREIPGFALFREPNRYKLVATLATSILAAYGAAALLARDPALRKRARIAAAIAVTVISGFVLYKHGTIARLPKMPSISFSIGILVAAAVLSAAALWTPARWAPLAICGLVLVHYEDLTRYGKDHIALREGPGTDREGAKYLTDLADVSREWRIWDEFVLGRRAGSRLLVRDLRGYVASDPFDTVRYDDVRTRMRTVPELLAAFNVRYVLWGHHPTRGYSDHILKKAPDAAVPARFKKLDDKRYEVVDPAPLVAWYGATKVVSDRKKALDALVAREQTVGGRNHVIVESRDRRGTLANTENITAPLPSVPGRLIEYGANQIIVEIDAPMAGVVVLNEAAAIGWTVEVDGRATETFRVDCLLRGITVTSGHHVMVWRYHPPHFKKLFVLWLAGFVTLLVAAAAAWRLRRRG